MTNQTTRKLSKTAAIKQARAESHITRFGHNDWKLVTWDEGYKAYYEGHTRQYFTACFHLREWRQDRVAELMGVDG